MGVEIVFGFELLKQVWSEEKDISDEKNIENVSNLFNLNFKKLSDLAKSNQVSKVYQNNTEEAVAKHVFGSPTYIFNNELFFGQDRLDFLERALKES